MPVLERVLLVCEGEGCKAKTDAFRITEPSFRPRAVCLDPGGRPFRWDEWQILDGRVYCSVSCLDYEPTAPTPPKGEG